MSLPERSAEDFLTRAFGKRSLQDAMNKKIHDGHMITYRVQRMSEPAAQVSHDIKQEERGIGGPGEAAGGRASDGAMRLKMTARARQEHARGAAQRAAKTAKATSDHVRLRRTQKESAGEPQTWRSKGQLSEGQDWRRSSRQLNAHGQCGRGEHWKSTLEKFGQTAKFVQNLEKLKPCGQVIDFSLSLYPQGSLRVDHSCPTIRYWR